MKILGIETSCDETAASVVEDGTRILSQVLASSADLHSKSGGIIPEVAARHQVEAIIPVISKAITDAASKSSVKLNSNEEIVAWAIGNIDAIAVTAGPGLFGSLLVGVEAAKTLALVWNKPLVPVVHILAHVYANWLSGVPYPKFPSVVLTVSGGHTELLLMRGHGNFMWLGGTRDDTAGEAFDKVARYLGLPFPGGPEIEKLSKKGDPKSVTLPKPMIASGDLDFSFSGLKTAVVREMEKKQFKKPDMAAAFQETVGQVLVEKTIRAVEKYAAKGVLLAGGVAANGYLRDLLQKKVKIPTFVPPVSLCTDNGSFIASYAYFCFKPRKIDTIKAEADIFTALDKYGNNFSRV